MENSLNKEETEKYIKTFKKVSDTLFTFKTFMGDMGIYFNAENALEDLKTAVVKAEEEKESELFNEKEWDGISRRNC